MTRYFRTPPPGAPRLFADSQADGPPAGVHIANIDGASRGNPGPAAYAVVLRDPDGKIIVELAKQFGRDTNNVAEYYGLLAALDLALSRNVSALRVRSDSELMVRQMHGQYKVKSDDLRPLFERAQKLSRQFRYFAIEHVRRELNREADALCNAALDGAGTVRKQAQPTRASAPAAPSQRPLTSKRTPLPRKIKARVENGALIPVEDLDLPEGLEVTIQIEHL